MVLDFGGGLLVLVVFCHGIVFFLQLRFQSSVLVWMCLFIFRYDLEGFLEYIGDDLCIFLKPCIGPQVLTVVNLTTYRTHQSKVF